ncbi:transglutaminase-like domain-containing protein [Winogradskyella psychrotolerans]|uniref:transglutaminase-like domain-containing protein n=1 Tax=Winogradskyella psychrotolerans TaxID=1344585 RepID=UPI001C07EBDF|nr:transglutaminase-like domain-containing protein [Winogradskyella psychrotolerans]MBU2929539.1 transglutaminase-like domain-containing protein [Winogradskyella psychrotolerans]
MSLKKIRWTLKRHPFLYLTRFRLLSKNSDAASIATVAYNDWNRKGDIPNFFNDINIEIFKKGKPETALELAKCISLWLCEHTKVGPGLSKPSDKALETMLYGNGGVCSDMAQIFNNFCLINDLQVREWGTTSAPFNRANGGHSFNEVYIKELDKWVLIDPSWGMLFYNENGSPLSVLELYNLSRSGKKINYKSFIPNKVIKHEQVTKNYLNPDITPFLICKYRNKTYDRYLKWARPYLPVFVIHFIVYLSGRSYFYQFPIDNYKRIFS